LAIKGFVLLELGRGGHFVGISKSKTPAEVGVLLFEMPAHC